MRKFRSSVLTFGCLVGVLLCVVQINYSQENNVQEIWQKVVNANKAWLEPFEGDVAYEYTYRPAQGIPQNVQIWYKGKDKARIQFSGEKYSPSDIRYNNGTLRIDQGDKAQYVFNASSLTFAKNTGYGITPLAALIHGNSSFKLLSAKKVLLNTREAYCIETEFKPFANIRSFFSVTFINMDTPDLFYIYADAKTFEILREESSLDLIGRSGTFIGEYPDGFDRSEKGFVPKHYFAYFYGNKSTNYNAWYEQRDNQIWYQKKGIYLAGTYETTYEIKSISRKPLDEQIFQIDPTEIEKNDPKNGESIVAGKVVDLDTRQPIQNASVRLLQMPYQSRTPDKGVKKTDANGHFQFDHVSTANYCSYHAVVEKEGYVAAKKNESISNNPNFPSLDCVKQCLHYLSFNENNVQQNLEIFLSTPRSLKGKVVEAGTQNPIKSATVEVLTSSFRIQKVQTSNDGSFVIDSLPACQLMIVAYADGYAEKSWMSCLGKDNHLNHSMYLEPGDPAAKTVDLSLSPSAEPLVFQLAKGGTLEGTITNKQGRPIEKAIVSVNFQQLKPVITDKNGFYQFKNLDIQSNQNPIIAAIAEGYVKSVSAIYGFNPDKTLKNLTLGDGGSLSGIISGENNQPIQDAQITLQRIYSDFPKDNRQNIYHNFHLEYFYPDFSDQGVKRSTTTARGIFTFPPLVPGKYKLTASAPGMQPAEIANIQIEEATEAAIKTILYPSKKISGIVIGPTNEPLENIQLTIEKYDPSQRIQKDMAANMTQRHQMNPRKRSNAEQQYVTLQMIKPADPQITKKDGHFEFDQLEEGTYRITAMWGAVRGNQSLYPIEYAFAENIHPGKTDIQIQFTEPLRRKAIIKGTVIDDETGKCIDSFLIDPDVHLKYDGTETIPKPLGQFLLNGVSMTDFSFRIRAEGYAAKETGFSDWQPKDIDNLIIHLKKEAKITGIIKIGKPLSPNEYKFLLLPLDGIIETNQNSNSLNEQNLNKYPAKIEEDGSFSIAGLTAGNYDLIIYKSVDSLPVKYIKNISLQFGKTTSIGNIKVDGNDKLTTLKIISEESKPIPSFNASFLEINKSLSSTDATFKIPSSLIDDETGILMSLEDYPKAYYHLHNATEEIIISLPSPKGNITLSGLVYEKKEVIKQSSIRVFFNTEGYPLKSFESYPTGTGRFNINNLHPGKIWIHAKKEMNAPEGTTPFRFLEWDLTPINSLMKIEFGNGVNCSGAVKNSKGKTVMGANVILKMENPFPASFDTILKKETTLYTCSNEEGKFHFIDVQPGKYTTWAFLPGEGVSKKQIIHIGENPGKEYEFVLE